MLSFDRTAFFTNRRNVDLTADIFYHKGDVLTRVKLGGTL